MDDLLPPGVLARIASRAGEAEATCDLAEDLAALTELGVLMAPLPAGEDGIGLGTEPGGTAACVDLLVRIGAANLSLARLMEGHVNAVKLVVLYGTPATRTRAFAIVRSGGLLGVWGADAATPVALRSDCGGLVLAGAKRFASGLGNVAAALVTAASPSGDGPQLILVPADDAARADASVWRQSGMRATRSGIYVLDGLRIEPDMLVGRPGDLLREPYFEGGVWRYCAAHLGGAQALYRAMVRRLVETGRADDPHQARRVFEAASACETARLWIESAAAKVEGQGAAPVEPEAAAAYALMAREATETACLTVMDRTERALGTAAFEEGDVDRIRRDLSLFLRQAAPDAKRARAARTLVATGWCETAGCEADGERVPCVPDFPRAAAGGRS
ncbi:acyl-CoA dehydrogenase family protein [Acuticoccus sp. I52.16.1]|uniref:acyl-CoA dehydrogenase family protein n=1 Tax=Acuticoccus sp. I52.16.1 TaxID=2928472 RepID=UPI001FD4F0C5|nr:acyl-CoA dehydrogenase family protein [Acuticoccus sp. I52.16.1]UOM36541.1 acyl-CoA/acyl-ACP dehydrogenase [Acuticoccus sp. I52.16.1]